MERSKIKTLATIFFCSYLVASCFANMVKAEDVVTGNIYPMLAIQSALTIAELLQLYLTTRPIQR